MTDEEQKETISINNDLFNNNNIDIDNIPWIISKYVFENSHEHGYKLHKGDIFKLGKYILRVKELGIDDDKKHFFFENKNTQKYMKDRSINNASQIPLNQQGENYFSALNLNQIINVQRKEDENNNNRNSDNNNENNNSGHNNESNNIENGSANNENKNENGSRNNSNKIHVVKNESNSSQNNNNSNSNSKGNEKGNGNINIIINNSFNPINLINNNNESKKEIKNENSISPDKSAYYNNNQSVKNINNQSHYNEIISYKVSNSNSNKNNSHFFINIITNNDLENNNNINALDDSKNKINNSSNLNLNSLGFNTFHNNSIMNSSINVSGKNISNFNNENEVESSKKNMNVNNNSNSNNNNNNNCHFIKSAFTALRSTASFKKKRLTNIVKRISKNSETITEKNNKPICRICLSEDYEENNPLIHPCNCDGTMKYIHLHCLKLLIQSKIKKTETESCKVFTFKTLECEICKMVFPEKIKIKGTVFYIIDFEKPDKDYIILDGLIKETPEEKSVFIVHFKNKKEIKIGRATDANIRLSDISVSRAHAVISQYNESFYLHDTNSKFGTLISAGNKFCILYNKPFSVQKGNILFEFMMKKTFCATLRCYHPSVVLYKTYNDFFDETFIYKYQTRDEEMLIPEKTKSVSEYSSHIINLKPANSRFMSSKANDIFDENNENENENNNDSDLNINKKKNSLSLQSKEDVKNSMNNNSPNNSNENNKKNENNLKNDINNNSQFFDSFKFDKEKSNNNENINGNNNGNYSSLGVNKTQEISNIYQRNEPMKSSNSKMGITLENQGNENSLLVNNI